MVPELMMITADTRHARDLTPEAYRNLAGHAKEQRRSVQPRATLELG